MEKNFIHTKNITQDVYYAEGIKRNLQIDLTTYAQLETCFVISNPILEIK